MNIFALDPDPKVCASYHCDQHLHKMILESAQMLCTAAGGYGLYTATHANHPCTLWVKESKENAYWLLKLCRELDGIRMSKGCDSHKSLEIAEAALEFFPDDGKPQTPFVFAGPAGIAMTLNESVHEKYKRLYILKRNLWAGTKRPMTYKGRDWPEFFSRS